MSRIAIVTDSTAYLSETMRKRHNIAMVPLNVIFGEDTYKEEQDITAEEFYKKMKETEKLPTTSQPSIGLLKKPLRRLEKSVMK
jgi:DegV family protein with EDD domain